MSSIIDEPARVERAAPEQSATPEERPRGLPPIGLWWPMLESPLQREVLENVDAPLRNYVVRRIFDLCELSDEAIPRGNIRLSVNERAYLAGWFHAVDWN